MDQRKNNIHFTNKDDDKEKNQQELERLDIKDGDRRTKVLTKK